MSALFEESPAKPAASSQSADSSSRCPPPTTIASLPTSPATAQPMPQFNQVGSGMAAGRGVGMGPDMGMGRACVWGFQLIWRVYCSVAVD